MTLETGDRIYFNISTGEMTLQFIQLENLRPDDDRHFFQADRPGRTSTVFLRGREVAVLLNVLKYPKPVAFEYKSPWGGLAVAPLNDPKASLSLESGDNKVALIAMEREMLAGAIQSRAWRLFQ